jgi:hypothetical protein
VSPSAHRTAGASEPPILRWQCPKHGDDGVSALSEEGRLGEVWLSWFLRLAGGCEARDAVCGFHGSGSQVAGAGSPALPFAAS